MNPTAQLLEPEVRELIQEGRYSELREILHEIPFADVADILAEMEPEQAALGFRFLQRDDAGAVFSYLSPEKQEAMIQKLGAEGAVRVVEAMSADDRAKLLDELPAEVCQRIVASLTPEERKVTQAILGYPPKTVGRLMTPDYLSVKPSWTVAQVLEHIRANGRDAETINVIYVVDNQGRLVDDIRLRQFLLADPADTVESMMNRSFYKLRADQPQEEAVAMMSRYDRTALPVVDSRDVLIGIVTVDDVVDVAQQQATESMQKMGGSAALEEPYLDVPVLTLFMKRGMPLAVLFVGGMLTASAMSHFQPELDKSVLLALFLPLIVSSGGNSGSQATSLIIRAMALGEIKLSDWWKVMRREMLCGLLLGVGLGLVGMVRILVWHRAGFADYSEHYVQLATTVMIAVVGVVMWGGLVGGMLPFLLRRVKVDPATSSAPFVATLVDVTGIIFYLSVAMIMLKGTLL